MRCEGGDHFAAVAFCFTSASRHVVRVAACFSVTNRATAEVMLRNMGLAGAPPPPHGFLSRVSTSSNSRATRWSLGRPNLRFELIRSCRPAGAILLSQNQPYTADTYGVLDTQWTAASRTALIEALQSITQRP